MNPAEPNRANVNLKTNTLRLHSYENGVWSLDSGYFRDAFDAVHFIEDNGEVAIVDAGTKYSVPRILQSLKIAD